MSFSRKYLPPLLAIGLGIANGVYVFRPSIEEQKEDAIQRIRLRLHQHLLRLKMRSRVAKNESEWRDHCMVHESCIEETWIQASGVHSSLLLYPISS
ncbi:hypothetical protein GE09DRAFT_35742 [Coniochaeta sp. 2T2.1]|nr:hypothetical protein GE09DRAFT_35742 [Coniochaeta sp. 2T2.1]